MSENRKSKKKTRRAFIHQASGTMGLVAVAAAGWPLIDQMNPSKDVEALATIEVDISELPEGQSKTVLWRGKPLFIKHRSQKEIADAKRVDIKENPKYLVLIGVCTHLGCVPASDKGDFQGWFCPCHGSHYDTSGRIRKGPAPRNLEIPPYIFKDDKTILVG